MATTTIHVFARWKVKAGKMPVVLTLLNDLRLQSINEKGNLYYQVHQNRADANTLILFEGYETEEAQQAHTHSDHFKKLAIEQIIPLLEEREVTLTTPVAGLT